MSGECWRSGVIIAPPCHTYPTCSPTWASCIRVWSLENKTCRLNVCISLLQCDEVIVVFVAEDQKKNSTKSGKKLVAAVTVVSVAAVSAFVVVVFMTVTVPSVFAVTAVTVVTVVSVAVTVVIAVIVAFNAATTFLRPIFLLLRDYRSLHEGIVIKV